MLLVYSPVRDKRDMSMLGSGQSIFGHKRWSFPTIGCFRPDSGPIR